ncbi:recombinase family protein [Streptomyces sp. NPDC050388]|uniref:recombinase family protein n=1 Tax=Streptomyces sp. NPDC050388 TaxID=3155781 RepID=UPI0034269AF5
MRRVLFAERISDDRNERSESIESQHDKLSRRAEAEGVTVVAVARDLSVSGDVDPFTRKNLGPWLAEENRDKWDELWVTTQDRLSRDDEHAHDLMRKVFREWGKKVVILDNPSLDFHTPAGRAMAYVQSIGPAMELDRIKQRVKESHERRRFTTRWPGGLAPFGYVPIKRFVDGRTATFLEKDPAMAEVLHEMRRQIIDGQSLLGVAKYLNAQGELTARDRARVRKGKPVSSRRGQAEGVPEQWGVSSVKALLTDPACLGHKKHQGKVLYDSQEQPIQLADPIFTDEEWSSLQAAIEARQQTTQRRVNDTSPLYGLVFCGRCGSKARHKTAKKKDKIYRYYVCGAWPKEAECSGSVRAEEVEDWLMVAFLNRYGDQPVTERVWVPGSDNTRELETTRKRISRLRNLYVDGEFDDNPKEYKDRMHALRTRETELAAEPVVEGHWSEKATGQTFKELWAGLDLEGKRKQLIKSGYRVEVGRGTFKITPEPMSWDEWKERLRARGESEEEIQHMVDVFKSAGLGFMVGE